MSDEHTSEDVFEVVEDADLKPSHQAVLRWAAKRKLRVREMTFSGADVARRGPYIMSYLHTGERYTEEIEVTTARRRFLLRVRNAPGTLAEVPSPALVARMNRPEHLRPVCPVERYKVEVLEQHVVKKAHG
jgi:hypothetical protein